MQKIAPVFEELAKVYAEKVVFIKVDGDLCRDLCAQKGVRGFPTFHIYMKGQMVESFSGADETRLRSTVGQFAMAALHAPSPYKHFPLRDEESTSFPKIKWPLVEEKIRECSKQLATENTKLSLEGQDSDLLDGLLTNLKNKYSHHNTPIPEEQLAIVDKMLQWPGAMVNHALHCVRLLVMHPHAAKALAARAPGSQTDVVGVVSEIAKRSASPVTSLLALQTLCNMFCRRAMAKYVTPRSEEIVDCIATLLAESDKRVMSACLALLINFAIVFREDNNRFESAKVHVLTNMMELFSGPLEPPMAYRACVVLGTLVFRDKGCTEIAIELELQHSIDNLKNTHSDNKQIVEVCEELGQAFADPSK